PCLAAVLVGEDAASQIYVGSKVKGCGEVGMGSRKIVLPASTGEAELLALVDELNADDTVDGIHPVNVGRLWLDEEGFAPATPSGIVELLKRSGIPLAGKSAAIVGRSAIVGKPMAGLLLRENCTVTVCHSKTRDLPAVTRQADLVVAAIGRPAFLGPEHVKEGAVVIDVGINRIDDPALVERLFPGDEERRGQVAKRGSTLVG